MNTNQLIDIPQMTINEVEQSIYNLDMCIDSINDNLHREPNMDPELVEQCHEVRDAIVSSRNKLHTALLSTLTPLDVVVN